MTILAVRRIAALFLFSLILAACGSSGGTSTPPAPAVPVAPPAPPPEPTFEDRLADWAQYDPNACRALTPGFEALGGWLKNDGREVGNSRVWIDDVGQLSDPDSHGAIVWASFTACAVRSSTGQYFDDGAMFENAKRKAGQDVIESKSTAPFWEDVPFPEPGVWGEYPFSRPGILDLSHAGNHSGQRVLRIQGLGNDGGKRTSHLQRATFQLALQESDVALWILVGGYVGEGAARKPADTGQRGGSSICGAADPLCLYASYEQGGRRGTSISTPQVAAALDTVWTVWPGMDVLDLRNLAFDCAENMAAPDGETAVTRSYSYSNGRSFTSDTNSTWGHGILSLTCLFTPNGGLQDPTTGQAISGGIYGPLAGPVTGASIAGVDYTGRDFGYGFARPVARENWALAALAKNLSAVETFFGNRGVPHGSTTVLGAGAAGPALTANLTVAGNALGLTAEWRTRGLTIRGGVAVQPEGVGSLSGSRAFRAPSTASVSVTVAYGRTLGAGLAAHVQVDHWRTLATHGRSLWQDARLSESRISAALVKRIGKHDFALQGIWRSGLAGSLAVSGRAWALAPRAERGVWLTWTTQL